MADFQVVVIGAGVGGLSAAAILASRGARVTVLERAEHLGGKVRREVVDGQSIDAGPTVVTMRAALAEVFREAGAAIDEHVTLTRLPLLARHFWRSGASLDLASDGEAAHQAVERFAGRAEAEALERFGAYAARIHELAREPFLERERPSLGALALRAAQYGPRAMLALDGHRTMATALKGFFRDARLRQLFGRFATYVGTSPYSAPATLNVISHVERQGVWSVEGGVARLVEALAAVAERHGAELRTGAHVARIDVSGGRARGVELASGERLAADAVLFNGDVAALTDGRLGADVRGAVARPGARSFSAVTLSMVASVHGVELDRHNVFFSSDDAGEFAALERGQMPTEPSIYICAQDRGGAAAPAPGAPERLFFILNAPPDGDRPSVSKGSAWSSRVLSQLQTSFGVSLDVKASVETTPGELAARFPSTGGALYGASSGGMTSSLSRMGARSKLAGLYLCGGSVHPGAGVPMAATSGRLAASAVLADRASTSRSRPTATRGGTWTS